MVDIHSHILPSVDDGAKNLTESLKLLEMMKAQGITDVFATPHFYPQSDNARAFHDRVEYALSELEIATSGLDLPKVHSGCELLYFTGIGNSDSIAQFCYGKSNFLLLETTDSHVDDAFFNDVLKLKNKWGLIPIIAHMERYCFADRFDELVSFVKKYGIEVQVNASSFFHKPYLKEIKNLIDAGAVTYLGTDAHSAEHRPPMLKNAVDYIENEYGADYKNKLLNNSQKLLETVLGE